MERTPFGRRLVKAREAAGLTQEEAAKAIGMAQSTLGEAETSGKRSGYASQLAELYRVNAVWLTTGKGQMRDESPATSPHEEELRRMLSLMDDKTRLTFLAIGKTMIKTKLKK